MNYEDLFKETACVRIKKGTGRTLKAGGAWIYDNEIDTISGDFENGDLVTVEDFDGYPLGHGFINTKSKLTVRMLSRKKDTVINEDFIEQRVRTAWEYRKATTDTSSCRVTFGEADFLPGIVVDKFEDVLVVESLALGIDRLKPVILDKLKKVLKEDGISIRGIYERSDAKVRLQEGMERFKGFIGEPFDTKVEICENGVPLHCRRRGRPETGFFLGSEIQPSGSPEPVPQPETRESIRLLYPYRLLCFKCRHCRIKKGPWGGRFPACSRSGHRKCTFKWLRRSCIFPVC